MPTEIVVPEFKDVEDFGRWVNRSTLTDSHHSDVFCPLNTKLGGDYENWNELVEAASKYMGKSVNWENFFHWYKIQLIIANTPLQKALMEISNE